MSLPTQAFPPRMKVCVKRDADADLAAAGLTSYRQIMLAALPHVTGHGKRSVHRVEFEVDSVGKVVFVKRFFPKPGLKGFIQRVTKRDGGAARVALEARFIDDFNRAGLATAQYLAWGTRGFLGRTEGFIIIAELAGYVPLDRFLFQLRKRGCRLSERVELARLVARYVRRMHGAGFRLPDLYAKHFFVADDKDGRRLALIDLQRARRSRSVPEGARARDLAALDASLPESLASATDRMRFLHEYLGSPALADSDKRFARAVLAESARLARRRRFEQHRRS